MATNWTTVLHQLRTTVLRGAERTDTELLEDFVVRRDEAALEALVQRHSSVVWGVCRRVLINHHDAEDACQATFLVLVRKAGSIASKELLANWLYGVAYRTAVKARAMAAKRRSREAQMADLPESVREPSSGATCNRCSTRNSANCPTNTGRPSSFAIWRGRPAKRRRRSSVVRKGPSPAARPPPEPCSPIA